MSRSLWALLALALVTAPRAWAIKEAPQRVIEYRDDKLTVHADKVPVGDILNEIAHQSGAEVRGQAPATDSVSTDFDAIPLTEALQRMLGENFTLRYGDDGKLKTIELKGGPEAPKKPVAATAGGNVEIEKDATPEQWQRVFHAFDKAGQVPIGGTFAKATQKDEANWDVVLNSAYGYLPDAKVRRDAVRAGLRALEGNPELKANLLDAVGAISDDELADFSLRTCKQMCEELLKNIVRETREPTIRTRAISLLRTIRKLPKPEPFTHA